MPTTGAQVAKAIQQDIPCPGCAYNLRSLAGPVVICPECGFQCDFDQLLRRSPYQMRMEATVGGALMRPVMWFVITTPLLAAILPWVVFTSTHPALGIGVPAIAVGGWLLLWLCQMRPIWTMLGWDGMSLVLGVHLTSTLMTLCVLAVLVAGIAGLWAQSGSAFQMLVITLVAAVLFGLAWYAQRWLRRACVRQYWRGRILT